MTQVRFKQVDVFTAERFKGNPVAVVLEADGLTDEHMQQIANWTNLSETTFVIATTSAEADYRVRIFTPRSELPFAGHPTIGTAHALMEAGIIVPTEGALVQECGAGLVKLEVSVDEANQQRIAFELPEAKFTPLNDSEVDELEAILGTAIVRDRRPALVDVGARWILAQLPDAQAVLVNGPEFERMCVQNIQAKATGVVIFGKHIDNGLPGVEVRAYAPACGVNEDPVCGSGNGAMAAFIRHTKQTDYFGRSLLASQGVKVGRAGFIHLTIGDDVITVGGQAVTCIDGSISI
ncbi:PhzF family phenazine biosynthesis protein [Azomonas macrocytogenes]|uniref:PhzF family phenazine biosynthesis protein n=1 Tax=Azomonas macrocytogenes TaxID=69962 RepID=A0A839TC89_AZOMA|nr:PhzF family phenazine biosynthesis protein [Azomonas macrocytogenes]MBB3105213.1 PhzF family phenazine biosynthesis protein [Azomonas macrocytogenes]